MNIIEIIDCSRHEPFQKSVDTWFEESAFRPSVPIYRLFFGFFCLDGWEEWQ